LEFWERNVIVDDNYHYPNQRTFLKYVTRLRFVSKVFKNHSYCSIVSERPAASFRLFLDRGEMSWCANAYISNRVTCRQLIVSNSDAGDINDCIFVRKRVSRARKGDPRYTVNRSRRCTDERSTAKTVFKHGTLLSLSLSLSLRDV